jgi:hypothetical protein
MSSANMQNVDLEMQTQYRSEGQMDVNAAPATAPSGQVRRRSDMSSSTSRAAMGLGDRNKTVNQSLTLRANGYSRRPTTRRARRSAPSSACAVVASSVCVTATTSPT